MKEDKGTSDPFQNELESILANRIDEEYIIRETGIKDLSRIEYISITVDTTIQSLFDLTDLLPNLKHLVLDNSTLTSIRDLGVGLRHLSSLSLSSCGIHDLDGIGVLTDLQELNLSDNYITDISPLTMHDCLQNLNLSGNRISDLHFGTVLASCPAIRSLFLNRNPMERVSKYRLVVGYLIPSLEMLDGVPLERQALKKVSSSILEDATGELSLILEEMEEEGRIESEIYGSNSYDRKVPLNSLVITNPAVSNSLKGNNHSTNTSLNISGSELFPDTGSELTHGSAIVLAGNVAAAMRKRRNQNYSDKSNHSNTDESKEFESALEVLDSALLPQSSSGSFKEQAGISSSSSSRGYSNVQPSINSLILKEGDITDQFLGAKSPMKGNRVRLEQDGINSLGLNMDYLTSPAKSNNKNVMIGDPGTTLLSATRRPQSAFSGTTYRFVEKSTPTTMTDNFSPRRGTATNDSSANSSALSSPRQRNSSRPQTAANPSFFDNLKFSFTTKDDQQLSISDGVKKTPRNDGDSDDEDSPIHQNPIRKILPPPRSEEKLRANVGKGSSIVHLDIVKRNRSEKLIYPLEDLEGGDSSLPSSSSSSAFISRSHRPDEDDDSDEDIAITHHERMRLMSAATQRPGSSSNSKSRQSVLWKLQRPSSQAISGIAIVDDDDDKEGDEDEDDNESDSNNKLFQKSRRKISITSKTNSNSVNSSRHQSMSSQIGKNLGFNLAGSLAAIDQWVHDMSSGDEDENDDNKNEKIQIIDLPNHYSQPLKRDNHSFTSNASSSNDFSSTSKSVPSLKEKILSRYAILTMCTNSSNPTPRTQFDSENSILVEEVKNAQPLEVLSSHRASDSEHRSLRNNSKDRLQKGNKLSMVQKKHIITSDYDPQVVVSTPDFEERVVSHPIPTTASSTSNLIPKKTTLTSSNPASKMTQSVNSLPTGTSMGKGTLLSNEDIVELLKKPPKSVPMLRTKTSFQEFFKGIDRQRFESLLQSAYSELLDVEERERKISRRLELMEFEVF